MKPYFKTPDNKLKLWVYLHFASLMKKTKDGKINISESSSHTIVFSLDPEDKLRWIERKNMTPNQVLKIALEMVRIDAD